jgi:hypothetical protein
MQCPGHWTPLYTAGRPSLFSRAGNYMPVGTDYTGIKGILVLFRNIRVWGIPGAQTFGRLSWVHTLSNWAHKGCHSTVPVCLYTLVKSNCRNIVFLLKLQGFQDLFRAGWLNGAKSKSYLVNRLPFSEPSLLGTIGKMRLVFYCNAFSCILCDIWEML